MPPYSTINLHPQDHAISSLNTTTYDVICIGSGWAGRIAASRVVKAGFTAIVIENELVGGDCPYWACVPSKALLRPQGVYDTAKAVNGVKQKLNSSQSLNAEDVFARRDMYTGGFDDGKILVPMVESAGVAIVRGTGALVGEKRVVVKSEHGEVTLTANHAVVLATGSEPSIPGIPGLLESEPWGPRQATSSSVVPEHLIVLGAGAVGCEMATVYASLGGKVSIVSSQPVLLPRFDPEVGTIVRESMEKSEIKVYTSARAVSVSKDSDAVSVKLSTGDVIRGTQILVAIGRRAKTTGVGLENFGISTSGKPVAVNDSLRVKGVSGGWLYAAGDINGRAPLTHFAKYEGRIVANSIIAKARGQPESNQTTASAETNATSQVVFTIPEVASVGHTRASATSAGLKFRAITSPLATLGANIHMEGYESGWAQWIIEQDTHKLLGATFCGFDCAELLHGSTVAIVGGMTLEQLSHAIPSFPTMSEVYLNLIDASGI